MNDIVAKYLDAERVGVLAMESEDGSPHGAVVHFACNVEPLEILIGTSVKTKKGMIIHNRGEVRASFVVGTDEERMVTFQANGVVRVVESGGNEDWEKKYLGKFPEKEARVISPESLRLVFVPSWWRWSDMKNKEVFSSE